MSAVGTLHERLVANRRVRRLAYWLCQLLPPSAHTLDVGCGDGLLSAVLQRARTDIHVMGIDVLPRRQTHIPVKLFDGLTLPFENGSFDVILFSDVLHHTEDPHVLLREAHRVSSRHVLIKDHFCEGIASGVRLHFMDWVGNARFGVSLPYNYWRERQWRTAWHEIGLQPVRSETKLGLYPGIADVFFGAKLHFITLLEKSARQTL